MAGIRAGLNRVCAALLVFAGGMFGSVLVVAAETATPTSAETCTVDLTLPHDARVKCGGTDFGTERRLQWTGLKPGEPQAASLTVEFADGQRQECPLLVEGGRRLQVAMNAPDTLRPQMAPQTGHTGPVCAIAYSPDGRLLATAGKADYAVRLWDAATGRELRCLRGHRGPIDYVAFCLNGKGLVSFSYLMDGSACLWDPGSGRLLRRFEGGSAKMAPLDAVFLSVLVHPDGQKLLTWSGQNVRIWDLTTGREIRHFPGPPTLAISPDGSMLANGVPGTNFDIELSEMGTDRAIRTLRWASATPAKDEVPSPENGFVPGGISRLCLGASFSPNGRFLAAGIQSQDIKASQARRATRSSVVLWDRQTGEELWSVTVPDSDGKWSWSFMWSPDSSQIAVAGNGVVVLDVATGKTLRTLATPARSNLDHGELDTTSGRCAAFSPDGRSLATGGAGPVVWDVASGKRLVSVARRQIATPALSPGGRYLARGLYSIDIWDLSSAARIGRIKVDDTYIDDLAWSPDEQHLAAVTVSTRPRAGSDASDDECLTVWNVRSFRQVFRGLCDPHDDRVFAGFSTDGKELVTLQSRPGFFRWWNLGTGKMTRELALPKHKDHQIDLRSPVLFFPDGRKLLWSTAPPLPEAQAMLPEGLAICILDVATGSEVGRVALPEYGFLHASLSKNARHVLTSCEHSTTTSVRLFDLVSGGQLREIESPVSKRIRTVAFANNDRWALAADDVGNADVWDIATGQRLIGYTFLGDDDVLVTTPEGLFDGRAGARQKAMFRVGSGLTVVPVDSFIQDFYYPGLLDDIWQGKRPMPGKRLGASPAPEVRILQRDPALANANQTILDVVVEDQGGGVKEPWVLVSGSGGPKAENVRRDGKSLRCSFRVPLLPGENRIQVRSASADGSWESEPAMVTVEFKGSLPKPELYVLSVGINRHADGPLRGCVSGATAVARLFERQHGSGYARVHVCLLADEQATAKGILEAILAIAGRAKPQDTLLAYFAGHGKTVGQRYYFLPFDYRQAKGQTPTDAAMATGLPMDELGAGLASVPTLKRAIILDSCQSGAATRSQRGLFEFRGAVTRFAHSQGVFCIAGAPAEAKAFEHPKTGDLGILTFALLAGIGAIPDEHELLGGSRVQPKAPGGEVGVLDWFRFAQDHLPGITRRLDLIGSAEISGREPDFPILDEARETGIPQDGRAPSRTGETGRRIGP